MANRFREIFKDRVPIQETYTICGDTLANVIQLEVHYDKGEGRTIRGFYLVVTPMRVQERGYIYTPFDCQRYRLTVCDRYSAKAEAEARKIYDVAKPQAIRDCLMRFGLKLMEE